MSSIADQLRVSRLRGFWVRWALRGVHYADRAGKLNLLYRVEDPWQMQSAREQARFGWTNQIIEANLAPVGTILEIGCGEGHQSQYLARACGQLYGIEPQAHGIFALAKNHHAAYALHAFNGIAYIEVKIVGDKKIVILFGVRIEAIGHHK